MLTDEQRGRFGAWLRRERRKRYDSVDKALAKAGTRITISKSEWAEYESGKRRPSADDREEIEAFLGVTFPASEEPQPQDDNGLAAAVRALAQAVTRQNELLERLLEAPLARAQSQAGGRIAAAADAAGTDDAGNSAVAAESRPDATREASRPRTR